MNNNYYNKYLKYKFKYINLINVLQKSGAITSKYDIIPFADYQTKINFIAWKPDCSALLILLNTNKYIINLYFFNSNRTINFTGHTNTINSVLWNFKGNKCVSASNDNKAIVWSTKYMKNETELTHSKSVLYAIFIVVEEEIVENGVQYKKNVEKILTSSSDNRIYLWDIGSIPKHLEFYFNITFIDSSYDTKGITKYIGLIMNNRVYITSDITNFITDKSNWDVFSHHKIVSSINFCFDSDYFVSGCTDGKIYIWNVNNNSSKLFMFDDIIYPIKQVSWSIDKKQILCAANNIVYIYDIFYNDDDDVDTEDRSIIDNLMDLTYIATYPPKLFKKISLFEENISFIAWNNTYYFKKIKNLGTNAPPSGTNSPQSGTNAPPSGTNQSQSGTNQSQSGTNQSQSGTNSPIKSEQQILLVGINGGNLKNKQVIEFQIINNELILPVETDKSVKITYTELINGKPNKLTAPSIINEHNSTIKMYNAVADGNNLFENLDIIFFVKMSSPKQVIKFSDGRELKTGFYYLFKKGPKEQIVLKQKTEQGGNITYELIKPKDKKKNYDIEVINGWIGKTLVINNVDDHEFVTYSAKVEQYSAQYLDFIQEFIVKMENTDEDEDLVKSSIPVSGMVGGNTDLTYNAGPIGMVDGIVGLTNNNAGLTNDNAGPTGLAGGNTYLTYYNTDLTDGDNNCSTGNTSFAGGNVDLACGPTGMVDLVIGNVDLACGPTGMVDLVIGNVDLAGGTTGPTGSTGNAENKYKTIKYSDRFIVCSVNGSIKIIKKLNTNEKTSLLINKQYQKMETILKTKIKINKTLDSLKEILYKK
jgi:WD40 repeat protein